MFGGFWPLNRLHCLTTCLSYYQLSYTQNQILKNGANFCIKEIKDWKEQLRKAQRPRFHLVLKVCVYMSRCLQFVDILFVGCPSFLVSYCSCVGSWFLLLLLSSFFFKCTHTETHISHMLHARVVSKSLMCMEHWPLLCFCIINEGFDQLPGSISSHSYSLYLLDT